MSLDAQDFAAFLSDQAQQECVSFEMANYAAQIDPDGLATRQAAKLQLLTTWHMVDTTGPDGESLDEHEQVQPGWMNYMVLPDTDLDF